MRATPALRSLALTWWAATLALTYLVVLLASATPAGASGVALAAVVLAATAALPSAATSVALRVVTVTCASPGSVARRAWAGIGSGIVRAQQPGRPGLPAPRAPGAVVLPSLPETFTTDVPVGG